MKKRQRTRVIDKVRASRDGHEFHEAWAARRALQLVMPRDDLIGIAIEGTAPEDQKDMPGVQVVVSCRTHRRHFFSSAKCQKLKLQAFTQREAGEFIRGRLPTVTNIEVQVAYARSAGNPRVLEHLIADRSLLDASDLQNKVQLDELLLARIRDALREAEIRGYSEASIKAFLAGLCVLPPPIPPREYRP